MEHFIPDLEASVSTEKSVLLFHADNNDFIYSENDRRGGFKGATERSEGKRKRSEHIALSLYVHGLYGDICHEVSL
jgi:hypothetical protein